MPTIFIDTEWSWRTGEPLALGVWRNGRYKHYSFINGRPALNHKVRIPEAQTVIYKSAVRDIEIFRQVFQDDGQFTCVNLDHVRKLTMNLSSQKEDHGMKLSQLYRSLGGIEYGRDKSHLYDSVSQKMLDDLEADVKMTKDVYAALDSAFHNSPYRQPEILKEWNQDSLEYILMHRPVYLKAEFIDTLNNFKFVKALCDKLVEHQILAFTPIMKEYKDTYEQYPYPKWNPDQWTKDCLYHKWRHLLYHEKGKNGKLRARYWKQDREDDVKEFLRKQDSSDWNLRLLEPAESDDTEMMLATLIWLIGVLRTQRYHYTTVIPFINVHGTVTGRSTHNVSPYNAGGLIRANIIPATPDDCILSVDLKRQEPLITAVKSRDLTMQKMIAEKPGYYTNLAEKLNYSKEFVEATKDKKTTEHALIKKIGLGNNYMAQAATTFNGPGLSRNEQYNRMDALKTLFNRRALWQSSLISNTLDRGYTELPNGFRLYSQEDAEDNNVRQIVNFQVQGHAAAIMPHWLRWIGQRLPSTAYVACELYDGLYVHCSLDDADRILKMLEESACVWNQHFPLPTSEFTGGQRLEWIVEPQTNALTGSPYFTDGVVEKDDYGRMMTIFNHLRDEASL